MPHVPYASPTALKGDRALKFTDQDKLGFRSIAARIAHALVDHASDDGLVVGIEGAWGSGKSSLLFLIEDELNKLDKECRPTVISFRPWLVGNRDTLLRNFFSALSKAINQVAWEAGDISGKTKDKAKEAAEALHKFTTALSKAGALVEVAGGVTAFAPLTWVGKILSALGTKKDAPAEPRLDDLKENLIKSLQDLGHRFIVIIDDVDRLEPKEVIEILRLTRSVADFPNITYLLSYDGAVLAHNIEQATQVESGFEYLEKIVQLSVMVPKPETFQLRNWFGEELHKFSSTKNEDELFRLKTVIDYDGARYLKSPRSVIKVLDSLRFLWPSLRSEGVDLADLVWLQLIKNGNPKLYRWIEEYCATASVISLGTGSIDDSERLKTYSALLQTVEPGYFDAPTYRSYFSDQLPGVTVNFSKDGNCFELYQRVSERDLHLAISNFKLASPDHYRLYFAQSGPSHALTHADFEAFWSAIDAGADKVEMLLLEWHQEHISGLIGKADVLLERIENVASGTLTPTRSAVLLTAFSNAMDQACRIRPFERGWAHSIWDRAEDLVPICLAQLDINERPSILDRIFKDGKAITWLSILFRRETFAHGRYGSRPTNQSEWFFTELELDSISNIMLSRYRSMKVDEFLAVIDLINLLFAWQQGGDIDGPANYVGNIIKTDEGLIQVLEKLMSTVNSTDRGMYKVLTKTNLSPFLDYELAAHRVDKLKQDEKLGQRAIILTKAFEDARKD